jgi:hypothetical protein
MDADALHAHNAFFSGPTVDGEDATNRDVVIADVVIA